ncbi:MAG: CarD family transcriptional regulator [Treponemataceae bacterium]|nr:CarD family transcriptional regulator [Treponemataceae bacterium]
MSNMDTTYKVNQKIVYPSQGVGTITEIKEKEFRGEKHLYYIIFLDYSDMTVMIPVDKADELGLRAIVSSDEAEAAIEMMGQDYEPITTDWKLRYQMNLELLKKGSITNIASIVRCLYHRSKIKELPIQERKLYDSAKKLLEDEIAYSLGKTTKEVENMIHAKLEPIGMLHAKPTANSSDDDFDDDGEEFMDEDKPSDEDEDDEDEEMMEDEE